MNTVRIQLTNGGFAVIDADDHAMVSGHRWRATPMRKGEGAYAFTSVWRNGRTTTIYMHRLIAGAGEGQVVDHRDGDGLNNTRANLRIGTQSQNMANASKRPQNTSGYIGVTWRRDTRRWRAQIQINGKGITIGHFDTAEEAAHARAEYARSVHGEWASRDEVAA